MIDGLKLKITVSELREHCIQRASYHRKRGDEKERELPNLREALGKLKQQGLNPPTMSYMNKGGIHENDPIEDLEREIRDHRNRALVFQFFAGHLFDDDYTLKEDDLVRLEILKK